jgi:hypothetical protein
MALTQKTNNAILAAVRKSNLDSLTNIQKKIADLQKSMRYHIVMMIIIYFNVLTRQLKESIKDDRLVTTCSGVLEAGQGTLRLLWNLQLY